MSTRRFTPPHPANDNDREPRLLAPREDVPPARQLQMFFAEQLTPGTEAGCRAAPGAGPAGDHAPPSRPKQIRPPKPRPKSKPKPDRARKARARGGAPVSRADADLSRNQVHLARLVALHDLVHDLAEDNLLESKSESDACVRAKLVSMGVALTNASFKLIDKEQALRDRLAGKK